MGSYSNQQTSYTPPIVSNHPPEYQQNVYGPSPPGAFYSPHPAYGPPPPTYGPPQVAYEQHGPYGSRPTTIIHQPNTQGGWMSMPQNVINCPPGLAYLTMIDHLLVQQKVELVEAFTGFETANKYVIKNSLGQKLYYAGEKSDCLTRNCCGHLRPFEIKVLDNFGNQVINLQRPLACDSCCFPCCLQVMEVSAPPGTVVGTVQQVWSICCPSFVIKGPHGDIILRIEGPFCTRSICGSDVEFKVKSADGKVKVGKISKQWSGLIREALTDADFFGITFPIDLDIRMKAVMLGACFLIDAMFFEKSQNNGDRPGLL